MISLPYMGLETVNWKNNDNLKSHISSEAELLSNPIIIIMAQLILVSARY